MADKKAIECPKCFSTNGHEYVRVLNTYYNPSGDIVWNKHYYISLASTGTGKFYINTTSTSQPGQSTGTVEASGTVTRYYGDNLEISSAMSPSSNNPPYSSWWRVSMNGTNWYDKLNIYTLNEDKTITVSVREMWLINIINFDAANNTLTVRLTRDANSSSKDYDQTVNIEWMHTYVYPGGQQTNDDVETVTWYSDDLTLDVVIALRPWPSNTTKHTFTLAVFGTSLWWQVGTNKSYGYYALSLTNCYRTNGATEGWYTLGTTPSTQVQAAIDWSFGGNTRDTTWISNGTVPTTAYGSPRYIYVRLTAGDGSKLTINNSTTYNGYVYQGTTIYWAVTSSYYAFSANGAQTDSEMFTVPSTQSKTPAWIKAASISSTHCTADKDASTFYDRNNDTTITWTADSYWRFGSSSSTTTATLTPGGVFSASPDYIYVKITEYQHARATYSTGWRPYNALCTWTATNDYTFDDGTATGTTTYSDYLVTPNGSYTCPLPHKWTTGWSGIPQEIHYDSSRVTLSCTGNIGDSVRVTYQIYVDDGGTPTYIRTALITFDSIDSINLDYGQDYGYIEVALTFNSVRSRVTFNAAGEEGAHGDVYIKVTKIELSERDLPIL